LDAGLISSRDVVLDVGCGTGKSTRDAARIATQGSVVGIDLSAVMLDHARKQTIADRLTNVTYVQGDAQVYPFDAQAFDVAISSFGVMFFGDPVAAFTNIGNAIRPGGRLAVLGWRELARNEWLMALREALAVGRQLPMPPPDAPTPFALADPERVRRILDAAGFDGAGFEPIDELIEFGSDADDALGFIRNIGIVEGLTQDLDAAARQQALDALQETVVAHERAEGVLFGSSAWLITATRH
jgi:SAM-dependent methyltransferase